MPRIPEQQIEQLKQDISLLRLIESQGYQPKKQGKDYVLRCPFHEDDTPSLIISPDKNLYHCFGCGAAGSVIDWLMNTQKLSFRHAVELLRADTLTPFSAPVPVVLAQPCESATGPETAESSALNSEAEDQALLNQIIDYYHQTLKQSPEAQDYLRKRGLDHAELIDHFKLGYANRSLAYRLPNKGSRAYQALRAQLQRIGILRDSGHEHLNGSLVIPIHDQGGNVVEAYGRKILGKRLRKGTPLHLYLPGPHVGIFNREALASGPEIILCESLIDALTFWSAGYCNVTTSYGVKGFTDEILQALIEHRVERVLIAYDRDEAGNQSAEALAKQLNQQGIDAFRIRFPKGMDANDYAMQVTPASKSLGLVIRKAEFMSAGQAPTISTTVVTTATLENTESPGKMDEVEPVIEVPTEKPLPASPIPEANHPCVEADIQDHEQSVGNRLAQPSAARKAEVQEAHHELNIQLESRHYRIRGFNKNQSYEQLKINLLVRLDETAYVDTLDLYNARQRQGFIKPASIELGLPEDVLKADLSQLLLKLEQLQDEQIQQTLKPKSVAIDIAEGDRQAALDMLRDPDLVDRILSDFSRCGLIGEDSNKLTGYLACVSRKLDKPLAIVVQSTSAAGKTSLMDAILALIPEEDKCQYAAMTGQSLYYMGETDLQHKILAIAEAEGASNASYALKLLQSEGELTIASTGKDEASGDLVTKSYRVQGPVMLFFTTTAIEIDEELMNRCLILSVNEDRDQTQAIHARQRKSRTLEGLLLKQQKQTTQAIHQNAQRLLRSLAVVNPYAEQLTFIDDKTRTRRDHEKYLTLIDSVTLLHQYQREIKTINTGNGAVAYIEVTPKDIELANRLAHDILGRTLDELPPQTRKLLKLIQGMVQQACEREKIKPDEYRFSRKTVREFTGWGNTQLKIHLTRLVEMEHLLLYRKGLAFEYELLYSGDEGNGNHLNGLIDPENLRLDAKRSGQTLKRSGSGRPPVGARSDTGRGIENSSKPDINGHDPSIDATTDLTALIPNEKQASHHSVKA